MTHLTSEQLVRNALHRRAVEAVIWGMPAVNTDLMHQAVAREVKGGWNQIVYWSRLLDWKNQTLTPNPDAIYLMPFFNTAQAHGLVRDMARASRSSQSPGLQVNGDGSVDIYFAPAAPANKESNWVPTKSGGEFEVLFRFYGPEKSLFEKKAWRLPDIERA